MSKQEVPVESAVSEPKIVLTTNEFMGQPDRPTPWKTAGRQAYGPKNGAAWNPLRSFPPNQKCFCGSQIKAKKCCLPKQPQCVDEKIAKEITQLLKTFAKGGLPRLKVEY